MPAKLIIWIAGKPLLNGYKQREFTWNALYSCYIYEGREIDASDFNEVYAKAMKHNSDMNPRVRVVKVSAPARIESPVQAVVHIAPPTTPEEELQAAEAVIMRLAPERLKKKTGPKPAAALDVG